MLMETVAVTTRMKETGTPILTILATQMAMPLATEILPVKAKITAVQNLAEAELAEELVTKKKVLAMSFSPAMNTKTSAM